MELFVGNIHLDTTTNELKKLLSIIDAEARICFVEQKRHNGKFRFARIAEMSEDKARYIIAHMNHQPCRGKKLIVRPLHKRINNNNRRSPEHHSDQIWYGLENRVAERRALVLEERII
ncbi:MAG: RNA-binding protein [Gammaproteobacteria bacterium]|nr:RNA-binding protein [Gammaproteobacteria bacterium]